MASLKFHKVSSLPASCALGDVYYVVGEGIYVCTTAASSGATESANYTRFSYANDAASGVKGVTSLSDSVSTTSSAIAATSTAVKSAYDRGSKGVSDAANALSVANSKWAQKTATQVSGGTAVEGTVKGHFANTTGFSVSPIVDGVVYYKDTDTHNSHAHTFTVSGTTSTSGTATSVDVVSSIGNAAKSSDDLSSTYAKVSVPTLKVTNDLASEISKLKTVNTTGMQYKGTRTDGTVPAAGKVGDVYKVATKAIPGVGAEVGDFIVCNTTTTSATNSAWDVWQANVNKDAYWDTNTPVSGNFVVADGTTGKIKDSGYNFGSFALSSHNHASSAINAMTGYSKPTSASAIAVGDSLNAAMGKLEYKVDAAQTAANNAKDIANGKWAAVDASTSAKGIMKVGTGLEASSGTVSVKYGSAAGTACQGNDSRLNDARTPKAHTHVSSDVTTMAGYAISASSAPAAISTGDSLNVAIGKLEKMVNNAQTTATNKWSKAYAQALAAGDGSKAGVATFDSSSFTVSNVGHVGLAWATWATS